MNHISKVNVFLEVVKHESFTGAARALGMSGPAVSKQVKSLEQQLGVKLLNRTTRQVSLTEEGALYSEKARKALEDLYEAEQQIIELKTSPRGRLKINAPMSFGRMYLAEPIALFAKKYPEIEIEVDFDDRWVDVVAESYDVVIRIGTLSDSTLIARKLADCPIVLCAAPSLIKVQGLPSSIDQITDYPAVVYTKQSQSQEWNYTTSKGETGSVKLNRKFAANNAEMEVEACLRGVGIAVIPVFAAAEYLKSGELIQILPDYTTAPQRGIYAIFPENRYLSTRVRLFIDWLSQCSESYPW